MKHLSKMVYRPMRKVYMVGVYGFFSLSFCSLPSLGQRSTLVRLKDSDDNYTVRLLFRAVEEQTAKNGVYLRRVQMFCVLSLARFEPNIAFAKSDVVISG